MTKDGRDADRARRPLACFDDGRYWAQLEVQAAGKQPRAFWTWGGTLTTGEAVSGDEQDVDWDPRPEPTDVAVVVVSSIEVGEEGAEEGVTAVVGCGGADVLHVRAHPKNGTVARARVTSGAFVLACGATYGDTIRLVGEPGGRSVCVQV